MLYDESSKTLGARELAPLAFRRSLELAMVAAFSGGLAAAIGLPLRFPGTRAATARIIGVGGTLALVGALELLFFLRWRSRPDKVIEQVEQAIEARRQAGSFPGVLSRTSVALIGLLGFPFALGLVIMLPVE